MPLDSARQSFGIHPFTGAPLGAEVIGLDLSLPLATSDLARLHRAHLDYHVLVFRDQHITPAQQVDFSRHFGALQIHVLRNFQLPGQPEVLVISNIQQDGKPVGLGDAGHFWHSDLSYKETPSLGSMLHAQELPAEGGDTLFANQHAAWDALPDELKREVEGLQAEHWYLARYDELRQRNPYRPQLTQAQIDEVKPVSHPVVRTHPETGRRALFVSEHFTTRILGVSEQRAAARLGVRAHDRVADRLDFVDLRL
ncbi:MAG: TauD/TfdA family dioxygenase, partial [Oxalobacteraceae bacterium]